MLATKSRTGVVCVWVVLAVLAGVSAANATEPSVAAKRISASVNFDGKLDDPAWREAPVISLTQQSPRPGQATPYSTEVRVLVSEDAVYFGFKCHDPHPEAIAVHTMRRDGDDGVAIVLDTYGDHRTGYYFRINAAGARVDAA